MFPRLTKALRYVSFLSNKEGTQLFLFLSSQLTCIFIAIASLQYIQTREETIATLKLHEVTYSVKDKVSKFMDALDIRSREVSIRLSFYTKLDNFTVAEGYNFLDSMRSKVVQQVTRLTVYDVNGIGRFSSISRDPYSQNLSEEPHFKSMSMGSIDNHLEWVPSEESPTTFVPKSFQVLRKYDGAFNGVLETSPSTERIRELCSTSIKYYDYTTLIVDFKGVVILQCAVTGAENVVGKKLPDALPITSIDVLSMDSGQYDVDNYILQVDVQRGASAYSTYTYIKKDIFTVGVKGLLIQNYIMLLVALLSQILCFMMFNKALHKSFLLLQDLPKKVTK